MTGLWWATQLCGTRERTLLEILVGDAPVIGIVRDLIVIGAAIVGMYVGLSGLKTWKRQLRGAARLEIARRAIRALRGLQSAVVNARIYFIHVDFVRSGGTSRLSEKLGERPDPDRMERDAIEAFWKAHAAFRLSSDEASDLIGQTAEELMQDVQVALGGFQFALVARRFRGDPKVAAPMREAASGDKADEFDRKLNAAIEKALEFFRKEL